MLIQWGDNMLPPDSLECSSPGTEVKPSFHSTAHQCTVGRTGTGQAGALGGARAAGARSAPRWPNETLPLPHLIPAGQRWEGPLDCCEWQDGPVCVHCSSPSLGHRRRAVEVPTTQDSLELWAPSTLEH
jgi:hypothetical protein